MKFAIIGCGRISHKHIEALVNNSREARLVAVSDIINEKMDKIVKEYHDLLEKKIKSNKKDKFIEEVAVTQEEVKKYRNYKDMLENEEIDIVSICTESGYHAKHAIDCLEYNKHVLVEKPMALSIEDADEIIKIAKENNLKLGVCHQNRFNPPIQKLKRAIDEGRFGKIINGTARILWTRDQNYYNQASWRGTKALDGGTLMNQCIHNIDLLQWMMDSEVERIHCERGTFLRNIEMEDFGAILIRFRNGSIGIVEGSACVYPKNLEETLSIFGENGTVVIGGLAVNEIKTWQFADERDYDKENENTEVDSVYGKGHTPLYKDFIDAVNSDREPYINGDDGKKGLEIILKAYEF